MIPVHEALKAISLSRRDGVVVSTSEALRIWPSVSTRRDLDVDLHDCVDKACLVGLGVALAQQNRKVLILDCDTALRASVGSLITIGAASPKNLVHFLFEDGPTRPGSRHIDYQAHSRLGGYARTFGFNNLEDLVISLEDVIEETGPTFVTLKVDSEPVASELHQRTMWESLDAVRSTLKRESMASGESL